MRSVLFASLVASLFAWGMASCGESRGYVCGDCPVCNLDSVCDEPSENAVNCRADCATICDLASMTGTTHDFIVSEVFIPFFPYEASDNGVDIDGDGVIDNQFGQIHAQYLSENYFVWTHFYNGEIAAGRLMILLRVTENDPANGVVAVQVFQGALNTPDGTPLFDGNDQVLIHDNAPRDLHLCGDWANPDLRTTPSNIAVPLPYVSVGSLWLTLTAAHVHTVDDLDSDLHGNSSVRTDGWTNVMIGGGLSQEAIYGPGGLLESQMLHIQNLVQEGDDTAQMILDLFDGKCVELADQPGCETIPPECAEDGVIEQLELECNAMFHAAYSPDVDIDGDGENDLLSLGYRIVAAVPVEIMN